MLLVYYLWGGDFGGTGLIPQEKFVQCQQDFEAHGIACTQRAIVSSEDELSRAILADVALSAIADGNQITASDYERARQEAAQLYRPFSCPKSFATMSA